MAFDDEDLKSRVESWWQRPFSDFIGMTEEPEFNFSIRHYSAFSLLQVDILNESKKDKHWFLIPVGKRHHPQIYNVVITDFLLSIFRDEKHNRACAEHKNYKKLSREEYVDFICEHG